MRTEPIRKIIIKSIKWQKRIKKEEEKTSFLNEKSKIK